MRSRLCSEDQQVGLQIAPEAEAVFRMLKAPRSR
jgi:hypothetical protein